MITIKSIRKLNSCVKENIPQKTPLVELQDSFFDIMGNVADKLIAAGLIKEKAQIRYECNGKESALFLFYAIVGTQYFGLKLSLSNKKNTISKITVII